LAAAAGFDLVELLDYKLLHGDLLLVSHAHNASSPALSPLLCVISLFGDLSVFTYFQNYCGCTVLGFGFGELFLWNGC